MIIAILGKFQVDIYYYYFIIIYYNGFPIFSYILKGDYNMEVQKAPTNGKAIASLVLGILAAVCVFFGYGALLGIVLGVVGLILGIQAKKAAPSGMATAGVVLSIISIAICAIGFIACVACVASLGALGSVSSLS